MADVRQVVATAQIELVHLAAHGDRDLATQGLHFRGQTLVMTASPTFNHRLPLRYTTVAEAILGMVQMLAIYGYYELNCNIHIREYIARHPSGKLAIYYPVGWEEDIQ